MTIGEKIRDLRKRNGLTQQQLADQMGITASAISQFESKKNITDFKSETLTKIADALGVSYETLVDGTVPTKNISVISPPVPRVPALSQDYLDKLLSSYAESVVNGIDGFSLFLQQSDIRIEEVTINDQQHYAISLPNTNETCLVTIDQLDLLPDMTAEVVAGIIRAWSHKNSEPDEE